MSKKNFRINLLCLTILLIFGCGPLHKANSELKQHRYSEAINIYQQYLSENPESIEARTNMGYACMKSGDTDRAIRELNTVLKAEPDNPDAVLYMGLAHIKKGGFSDAVRVLDGYHNEKKPIVEEEIRHQAEQLKSSGSLPSDESARTAIISRIESNVENAMSMQKEADREAARKCDCEKTF